MLINNYTKIIETEYILWKYNLYKTTIIHLQCIFIFVNFSQCDFRLKITTNQGILKWLKQNSVTKIYKPCRKKVEFQQRCIEKMFLLKYWRTKSLISNENSVLQWTYITNCGLTNTCISQTISTQIKWRIIEVRTV